ncbi:MAG: GIY-YIG nuclease family protein [Ignavibacteria bacterium]|nr:GIY-YIG nuclease family protein [Ignavibacteria bacterium]MCC7158601.1 GIY-YIG nuclease family protein [Ignavibacteria bacterium]
MYYAYILVSLRDGRYYYGSSGNIDKRLIHHNSGKVKSTKNRKPLKLHYSEKYSTRKEAEQRERFFKSIDGYIWLKQKGII